MRSSANQWIAEQHGFRRRYERKNYQTEVMFVTNGRMYKGGLIDISIGGAFILSDQVNQFIKGNKLSISIPFTDGHKHIKRKGTVLWKNSKGFAIEFN